jgi:hypothetical protein
VAEGTVKAEATVEKLYLKIGDLEVTARASEHGGTATLAYGSRVRIDGQIVPVRAITIRGDVDSLWVVELEYYPGTAAQVRRGEEARSG